MSLFVFFLSLLFLQKIYQNLYNNENDGEENEPPKKDESKQQKQTKTKIDVSRTHAPIKIIKVTAVLWCLSESRCALNNRARRIKINDGNDRDKK